MSSRCKLQSGSHVVGSGTHGVGYGCCAGCRTRLSVTMRGERSMGGSPMMTLSTLCS